MIDIKNKVLVHILKSDIEKHGQSSINRELRRIFKVEKVNRELWGHGLRHSSTSERLRKGKLLVGLSAEPSPPEVLTRVGFHFKDLPMHRHKKKVSYQEFLDLGRAIPNDIEQLKDKDIPFSKEVL